MVKAMEQSHNAHPGGKASATRRSRGRARRSAANHITVEIDATELGLDLEAGDDVDVVAYEDGSVRVQRHRSRLDGVAGTVPGFSEGFDIDALRDEWEER